MNKVKTLGKYPLTFNYGRGENLFLSINLRGRPVWHLRLPVTFGAKYGHYNRKEYFANIGKLKLEHERIPGAWSSFAILWGPLYLFSFLLTEDSHIRFPKLGRIPVTFELTLMLLWFTVSIPFGLRVIFSKPMRITD